MSIEASEATTSPGAMLVAAGPAYETGAGGGGDLPPAAPRSLARQAVVDTLASRGARVGLAWLVLLALFAVFGPFLASSHPILMKLGGSWSSPLLRHLTPADVLFLIAAATAVTLAISRRYNFGRSVVTV